MKVGDLVRPCIHPLSPTPLVEQEWNGLVIGYEGPDPVVYWNNEFPAELEYEDQLEVVDEKDQLWSDAC